MERRCEMLQTAEEEGGKGCTREGEKGNSKWGGKGRGPVRRQIHRLLRTGLSCRTEKKKIKRQKRDGPLEKAKEERRALPRNGWEKLRQGSKGVGGGEEGSDFDSGNYFKVTGNKESRG